jgi:Protein involved in formate dehydrogenase formation
VNPWPARRQRAQALRAAHPFAAEVLTLYLALVDVQEQAWDAARDSPPTDLCAWTADHVLPAVVEATVASGPAALAEAVDGRAGEAALAGWLDGAELEPVDRYLARAALGPVLEALGWEAGANGHGGVRCPRCGGPPQLSYVASTGEALVSGQRSLLCARCGASWACSRSTCPACEGTADGQLTVYAERFEGAVAPGNGNEEEHDGRALFPHMRIAGCTTCRRYLIEIDMERDARAVPEVDELTAIPLDLYAADHGLTKLTANLMGF